jgi:hypothetical protein
MDKAAICPRENEGIYNEFFNTGVFTSEQSKVSPCYMWVSYAGMMTLYSANGLG